MNTNDLIYFRIYILILYSQKLVRYNIGNKKVKKANMYLLEDLLIYI